MYNGQSRFNLLPSKSPRLYYTQLADRTLLVDLMQAKSGNAALCTDEDLLEVIASACFSSKYYLSCLWELDALLDTQGLCFMKMLRQVSGN